MLSNKLVFPFFYTSSHSGVLRLKLTWEIGKLCNG